MFRKIEPSEDDFAPAAKAVNTLVAVAPALAGRGFSREDFPVIARKVVALTKDVAREFRALADAAEPKSFDSAIPFLRVEQIARDLYAVAESSILPYADGPNAERDAVWMYREVKSLYAAADRAL